MRVLIVEDLPSDAELAERELSAALGRCDFRRVETREEYLAALEEFEPALIVSDFALPRFDGLTALRLAQEHAPDVPFVLLTGSTNEDTAVECMKAGAWDYVIKEHVKRLGSAVLGVLEQKRLREEQRAAATALRRSEERLALALRASHEGVWDSDLETGTVFYSEQWKQMLGYAGDEIEPNAGAVLRLLHPDDADRLQEEVDAVMRGERDHRLELRLRHKDGHYVPILSQGFAVRRGETGPVIRIVGTHTDLTERNEARARIEHLNAVLRAIRGVNQLIVREKDPRRLIERTCELLVEHRGYRGAWIALAGEDGRPTACAQAGWEEGFAPLEEGFSQGRWPACSERALTSGTGFVVVKPSDVCAACPLSRLHGRDVVVVTPLLHSDRVHGVLEICLAPGFASDEQEQALIAELAADVAFALHDGAVAAERSRVEEALTQSERRFRALYESMRQGVFYQRADGVLLDPNPAALEMLGLSREEFTSRDSHHGAWRVIREDGSAMPAADHPSMAALETGRPVEAVVGMWNERRQQDVWMEVSAVPQFRDGESVPHLVAVTLHDVTERKRAREALERASVYNRTLFDASLDPLAAISLSGTITDANGAMFTLTGRSREELIGTDFSQYFTEPDRARAGYRQALLEGRVRDYALDCRRQDGHVTPVLFNASVYCDESGGVAGVFVAAHDITERKRVGDALRFQKMLLESQNEASIDGILIVDVNGRILSFNRQFLAMFGIPREVADAGSDSAVMAYGLALVADPDGFAVRIGEIYGDRNARSRDEVYFRDGRVFDRYSAPIMDEGDAYLGRFWLFRDVSERIKLLAGLAQADRLASMGMLAAGVAHEINNPLTYVLYNLESLSQNLPTLADAMRRSYEELSARAGPRAVSQVIGDGEAIFNPASFTDAVEQVREALAGTERIKDIARGLGTFSRVEQTELGPVDLQRAVEHALSIAFNEIKYRARLVKHLQPVPAVLGSDGKLAQVVLNLVINAAHAIAEGDVEGNEIRVGTWAEGGHVFVEVGDTGTGIAPEHRSRIFEPFFTTKGVGAGSGLGLAICRNIVTGFGGDITFESEVGKGTRFLVRLPVMADDVAPRQESPSPERLPAPEVRGRILVVDDVAGVRGTLKRLLGAEHELVLASSGQEGQAILERDQRFDVLFFDLMMPRMSGMELHEWLAQRNPDAANRVVFITGGAFTPRAAEYLAKASNRQVAKPFDLVSLRRMVHELVLAANTTGRT